MDKYLKKCIFVIVAVLLFACEKKEQKPFGALEIEYGDINGANVSGPSVNEFYDENVPPFETLDTNTAEQGPAQNVNVEIVEPTAESEINPDYGGIPVVTREREN